jgi:uncharacterized membrane protein YkvA (DUF1232 family)
MFKRLTLLWTVLRGDARQLWFALRHPLAPGWLKLGTGLIVLYVLSPIDLIPDFIPVLGQLDDLVIVPLGIALAIRLTPRPLWEEVWHEAETSAQRLPRFRSGAVVIGLVWAVVLGGLAWCIWRAF